MTSTHALRLALALCLACATGSTDTAPDSEESYRLLAGLGAHQFTITTASPNAQRYFDQGLVLSYGFNHYAAIQSFGEAARLDPQCAMCFWGIALANGPNINVPMGPDGEAAALVALAQAQERAPGASAREQAYIAALAQRYQAGGERAALDAAYAHAMGELHRADPSDDDAATLFAESLMDLSPWNYWDEQGQPREHTDELLSRLELVLARDPQHPGANHLYIHAVEASPNPSRGVPAADRLAGIAPAAGHLVHMPSHIYWRVGRYADATSVNVSAIAADDELLAWCRSSAIYRGIYYPHNIHFLWSAAWAEGRSELALTTARELANKAAPMIAEVPRAELFTSLGVATLARFGRWDAVLGEPRPPAERRYATGIWHYARALAHTRQGELELADQELLALQTIAAEPAMSELEFAREPVAKLLRIGVGHARGELAAARGDYAGAESALHEALAIEDGLQYTEPPRWHQPIRQALGAIQLRAGRAGEAEATYRDDLRHYPTNGWSLYGLAASLRAQGRSDDAALVTSGFEQAWSNADVKLSASIF